ncbi:MAG: TetR/AcrR family transcriptional regulator [bacterium]
MTEEKDIRKQIIQATEAIFSRKPCHEITISDIAQAAQVSKGTIYRYFQDKDELIFETVSSGFDDLCSLLSQNIPEDAPFSEQIRSVCKQISGFFNRRHQLLRLMQAEEGRIAWCKRYIREECMQKHKNLVDLVALIISKGMAEGKIRKDVPAHNLATLLLGMLKAQARSLADFPAAMKQHDLIADLFCRGAGPLEEKASLLKIPDHT